MSLLLILLFFVQKEMAPPTLVSAQENEQFYQHLVEPGDTWAALSRRYNLDEQRLKSANPSINQQRQPVIGKQLTIPVIDLPESKGTLVTRNDGGLLQLSIQYNHSPWMLALSNNRLNPHRPLLYQPLLIPDGQTKIRQFPVGLYHLELSDTIAHPGKALAIRAEGVAIKTITASLDNQPINLVALNSRFLGLFGTGAFFPPGEHDLNLSIDGGPLWTQPWLFEPGSWSYDEITLTGSAAAIDSESIKQEFERLSEIWAVVTQPPMWDSTFLFPLDSFLSISSEFGARRSYNGGPFQTYHEGVDFSAYGGTPVLAPANGTVVLAEILYVRGGAVIIDHGLGLYSGTYHLNEVLVQPGQFVERGQVIGKVGSTGLSTGNHLHWDLLAGGTWVDPVAWFNSDLACWVLESWGTSCHSDAAD